MARPLKILVFIALGVLACACAHVEPLEPAAAAVAVYTEAGGPRGCVALGDVRGVEDEALPHDQRVASAVNAMRNEAARRGANRVDRVVVELSETPDGPPHAVAFALAYRCDTPLQAR